MTTKQIQKIEKMAKESMEHARQAVKKSDQLQAILSLLDYRRGKVNRYTSVKQLFKKLKIS